MMRGCGWTRYQSDNPTIAATISVTMTAGPREALGLTGATGEAPSLASSLDEGDGEAERGSGSIAPGGAACVCSSAVDIVSLINRAIGPGARDTPGALSSSNSPRGFHVRGHCRANAANQQRTA